ncbi:hypothetical protein GCM10022389_15070 [Flavobacterium cheonanense]|uniref:Transcription factor zinc-finger domain-containing protein n=1 Tax=Flavobacterium cheonanense TaxID=706183 RepID=A0ABP7VN26_9FLAO
MIEKPLTKISGKPQEDDNRLEKNVKEMLSKTYTNSNFEQTKENLSNESECLHCQLKNTINSEHEYDIHQSVCNDCKKDFWLITGSLTDYFKKKEQSKINITDFLIFA